MGLGRDSCRSAVRIGWFPADPGVGRLPALLQAQDMELDSGRKRQWVDRGLQLRGHHT